MVIEITVKAKRGKDGDVFAAFWCYEQNVSLIRWFRFRVL